jgi:hypothetical protein
MTRLQLCQFSIFHFVIQALNGMAGMNKELWKAFNVRLLQKGQHLTLKMVLDFYELHGLYQDNLAFPRHVLQNFLWLSVEHDDNAYLDPQQFNMERWVKKMKSLPRMTRSPFRLYPLPGELDLACRVW